MSQIEYSTLESDSADYPPEEKDYDNLFLWRIDCVNFFAQYHNKFFSEKIKIHLHEIMDISYDDDNFEVYLFELIDNIKLINSFVNIPFRNKKKNTLILNPNPYGHTELMEEDVFCCKYILSNSYNSINMYTLFFILYFVFNERFKNILIYKEKMITIFNFFNENFDESRSHFDNKNDKKSNYTKLFFKIKEYKKLLETLYYHPDNIENLRNSKIFDSEFAYNSDDDKDDQILLTKK